MRKLIWGGGIVAALWCGYWGLGTYAIRQGAYQAIDEAARQGNFIAPEVATAGFPTSFDITLQRLDFGNPSAGLRWNSPSLRVQAAAWRPWHVVALLDDTHGFTLPNDTINLTVDDARASLTVTPDTNLTLSQLALTITEATVTSALGWTGSAQVAEVHVNLLPDPAHSYAIVVDATQIGLDPAFTAATGLAGTIGKVEVDATVSLSAPLDRKAAEAKPSLTAITLKNLTAEWGDVVLSASGTISADAQGLAEGRFDIVVANWRSLIPALVAAGAIQPDVAPTITGFLNAFATQGGDPDTLPLPLIFANGRGTLGPLPLGPAPRLN